MGNLGQGVLRDTGDTLGFVMPQEQLSPPRPPSPPAPQPQECYRLALERRLAELEEKGLVQILRGPDGDVAIEIVPVVIETAAAPVVTTEATAASTGTAGAGVPFLLGTAGAEEGWQRVLWAQPGKPRQGAQGRAQGRGVARWQSGPGSGTVGSTGWADSCGGAHTVPLLSSATQCHHRRLHVPQVLQQTAQHPRGEGCEAAAPLGGGLAGPGARRRC